MKAVDFELEERASATVVYKWVNLQAPMTYAIVISNYFSYTGLLFYTK